MPAMTTNLFLLQDLEAVSRRGELAESDREALQAVADWITTFVVRPHKDLGRAGTVCPFVPGSLERNVLWLAPEQIADRGVPHVVELMHGYMSFFLDAEPTDGNEANYKVIVVVFTDLSADRAQGVFDDRTPKMESCSGRSTRAMTALRYTSRAFAHSNHPRRFCSCGKG